MGPLSNDEVIRKISTNFVPIAINSLAIYVRTNHQGKLDGPPVLDSVTLSKREWADLTPPTAEVGATWTVSGSITRKFCPVLSPVSDHSFMPRPEDATVAKLTGIVEALDGGSARIRLTGSLASTTPREGERDKPVQGAATAEGIAVYDVEKKELRSVLLIFDGTYRMVPPWDKSLTPIRALAEWRSEIQANH